MADSVHLFPYSISSLLGITSSRRPTSSRRGTGRLTTPSLGITLRAIELQGLEVSFQLPLSGSPFSFLSGMGLTEGVRTFNSLSRDHFMLSNLRISLYACACFQLPLSGSPNPGHAFERIWRERPPFNSLSRDHRPLSDRMRLLRTAIYHFQLPLSGSLGITSSEWESSIANRVNLSTPSLGITGSSRQRQPPT